MRFASLGSGSRGNALIVEAGATRVLLDCGFSVRTCCGRLDRLGIEPESLDAIVVTHEHGDHVAGVFKLARRFNLPVYLTHGTYSALSAAHAPLSGCRLIDSHAEFFIDDLAIQPFPVPHDAREPVQYVFSDGTYRLGVLTDTGVITPHVVDTLQACDALLLECNHDARLLASSSYPETLKRRISGNYGHLENQQAAALLAQIDLRRLQHLVAAHLSEQNNRPELAVRALADAVGCAGASIGVATQETGFDWRLLG